MKDDNIVEVRSLIKRYGDVTAVNSITFDIRKGEIFGFLGPNGAGKTSTISTISCRRKPTAGTVVVNGFDVRKNAKQIREFVGIVPQCLALYPSITVVDNLSFFGSVYGLSGGVLKKRIDETLEIVGLSDRANVIVESLSGGMKRRLNLACGLLHNPQLILLDEPTVGVDLQSRNRIFENIRRLNEEYGMTVLYTTHYMEEAENLCQRVAIIDKGEIAALDSPKNLISEMGDGFIEISVSNASEKDLEDLNNLPHVNKAFLLGGKLKVQAGKTHKALLGVLFFLNEKGISLESLQIKEPSLEDVFLKLTGKILRDSCVQEN